MLGDALRVQLLGSHDSEVRDEESRLRQQLQTRHVLEPFHRCCVAHAGSLLPSALFFFCCDYGATAAAMAQDLFRQVKSRDPAVLAEILVNSLQFAFSAYKTRRVLTRGAIQGGVQEETQGVEYEHFQGVSRRLSRYLGVRLSYPLLVAIFAKLRVQ